MKVLGPLFSKTAAGTPKDFATFSYRRTGQQARIQKKQVDSNTISQQTQRAKFFNASLACRFFDYGVAFYGSALFGNEIELYNEEAKGKSVSGYNLCIKEFLNTV